VAARQGDDVAAAGMGDDGGGFSDPLFQWEIGTEETSLATHLEGGYTHGASSFQPGSGFVGIRPG